MNKIKRKLVLSLTALLTVGALAGCGRTRVTRDKYPTTVVATLGDTKIYLDEANYMARSNQYMTEMYYSLASYNMAWDTDLGTGDTLEDYTKQNTMASVYQTYVLKAKAEELGLSLDEEDQAKVDETVQKTMEEMEDAVKEATDMTEERLKEIVTNNALAMKAYEYAVKDVDTVVSDEEAAQRTIRYVQIKDGEDADAVKTLAEEIKGRVEAGENSEEAMKAIAEENEDSCTYSTITYGDGDYDNVIGNLGRSLATGETGSDYQEGYGWYVAYCVTDFDKEATEEEKPDIVDKRKAELFQTVYAEWLKDMPKFKVDEKVWSQITFDKALYTAPETTAAGEETTGAEGETTAAGTTAAQ